MLRRLLGVVILLTLGAFFIQADEKTIADIAVYGNTLLPDHTIKTKIPYRTGATFDPFLSSQAIHTLYQLDLFRNVRIEKRDLDADRVQLIITLEEKDRVENISFHGNKQLDDDKLKERINASDMRTIDEEEITQLERIIRSAYQEKNYHNVTITPKIERTDDKRIHLHFYISEGKRSVVKRVRFVGNASIPTKELRKQIFTREEWILSFFDKAGTYHPDALEQDKYMIENTYHNNGFLAAQVTDADVTTLEDGNFMVTFTIDEGDIYTISDVDIEGNTLFSAEQLRAYLPVQPGQLYSKQAIRESMEALRTLWGEYGYIYADVHPSVRDIDEENKTVAITFSHQLGNQMFVDRINILGNRKTAENVIRRQLSIDEGDMVTQRQLDESQYRVQALGLFDEQTGVNWRFTKKDEEYVDLDMILQEAKTGRFFYSAGINMNGPQSPLDGFSVSGGMRNLNFMGAGIQYHLNLMYSRNDKSADFSVTDNWLFNKPIAGTLHLFSVKSRYEDVSLTTQEPEERTSGGMIRLGARPRFLDYTQVSGALGIDEIRYTTNIAPNEQILDVFDSQEAREAFTDKVARSFQEGSISWIAGSVAQDYRNHPYLPSRGYIWNLDLKYAFPTGILNDQDFAFFKVGLTGDWYTPLIGERTLVLHGHGFFGAVTEEARRNLPYRELFHIGGATTVRGYEFGQIGPQLFNDSLGGKKALLTNVELLFPISGDGNLRGVVFYDGGASWDTPQLTSNILQSRIENQSFEYRHSIGVGFRASSPVPVRVDWAFKLDRKKGREENISKVHITGSQDF